MEFTVPGKPFNGHHLFSLHVFHSRLAGENRFTVYKNRAGSAVLFAAAVLGSREAKIGSKNPKEHPFSIDFQTNRLTIELKLNGFDHGRPPAKGFRFRKLRAPAKITCRVSDHKRACQKGFETGFIWFLQALMSAFTFLSLSFSCECGQATSSLPDALDRRE